MIWTAALFVCLLLATAEATVGESPLCESTAECPIYKVLCQVKDVEVRYYESMNLVSTDVESHIIDISSFKGFKRLFAYITGDNVEGEKIDMTAPVIVKTERKARWGMAKDTVSFVLPSAHQQKPPVPGDSDVYIQEMTGMVVFVVKYSGWMNFWSEKRWSDRLASLLDKFGASYIKDYRFAAVYNSPMDLMNRRNEVWFISTGQFKCPSKG